MDIKPKTGLPVNIQKGYNSGEFVMGNASLYTNTLDRLPFGEWLRRRRGALDLTRDKLAWRVGCSTVTIKKIEAGDLKPSTQLAELLAAKLEVPLVEHKAFVQFARSESAREVYAFTGLGTQPGQTPAEKKAPVPNTLPAELTPLLGRARELATVCDLLRGVSSEGTSVRLLTLTGPPGAGKTRLSLAAAAALREEFADGVLFVPLAPIDQPELFLPALANVLGVQQVNQQPLHTAVIERLRDKRMLLVLDNFEQIVAAAPRVSELLTNAPQLKILVSSREALHVYGENEFPVPLLDVPDTKHLPPPQALAKYSSVELFVARARSVKPDFELTTANAEAIARLCALLDGLPLALEMAAAQSKRQSPARLLAQLEEKLVALGSGLRDLSPRQQTLRGALDWSYNLLDEREQKVFRALSVFVNGATRDSMVSCAAPGDWDVVEALDETLESLVDKNLVRAEMSAGEPRYMMLEAVRAYAVEKLHACAEWNEARTRHARYYLTRAQEQRAATDEKRAFDLLEQEHANLRAALAWFLEQADGGHAAQMCGALGKFWVTRGHWTEGAQWTERALAAMPKAVTREQQWVRAQALHVAAQLMEHRTRDSETRARYEESLQLRRALGDQSAIAESLMAMTMFCYLVGDREGTQRYGEEGLALCRALGDQRGCALMLNHLGRLGLSRDEHAAARAYLQESLSISRDLGDKGNQALALHNLGIAAHVQGRYAAARPYYLQALALRRELGDAYAVRTSLNVLGLCAVYAREDAEADKWLKESLEAARQLHDQLGEALALRNLATLAFLQGDLETARRLNLESWQLGERIGARTAPVRLAREGLAMIALAEGDYATAREYGAESLSEWQALRDREGTAISGRIVGFVELALSDYAAARPYFEAALENWRIVDNQPEAASALFDLGYLKLKAGEGASAYEAYVEGLKIARGLNDKRRVGFGLRGLAGSALALNEPKQAARLLGASEALNSTTPLTLAPQPRMMREDYLEYSNRARLSLDAETFEKEWSEGHNHADALIVGQSWSKTKIRGRTP